MPKEDIFGQLELMRGRPLQSRLIMAPSIGWKKNIHPEPSPYDQCVIKKCNTAGITLLMAFIIHVNFQQKASIRETPHTHELPAASGYIKRLSGQSVVQLHQAALRGTAISHSERCDLVINEIQICSAEIQTLRDRFVELARRAHEAEFEGVEINATSDSVFMQFLSPILNKRMDRYGGSLRNRARLLFEVIQDIRSEFRSDFRIAVRFCVGWLGSNPLDLREITTWILQDEAVEYIEFAFGSDHIPVEDVVKDPPVFSVFKDRPLSSVLLGCSGKLSSVDHVVSLLESGWDFVMTGESRNT